MSDNDSFGGTPLILERKIISREGAGIEVTQLKMSQAWYDGMARAMERGREHARKRTFRYQLRQFFSDLFSKTPDRSNDG
jgi:hypothetical protein